MEFRKEAFTLIELLVVIVVIGLLIGISIPVISKARAKAHIGGCANNMRQIHVALGLFAGDNNGMYPPDTASTDNLQPLYPSYIDDLNVFMCPAAKARLPKSQWVSKEEHLTHSRGSSLTGYDSDIGIDYEYRGQQEGIASTKHY